MERLYDSIEWSRKKLAPFRAARRAAIKQYVGNNYSEDGAPDKVPINMVELAVSTYARLLAAKSPRVTVSTRPRELKFHARNLELLVNDDLKRMEFGETAQRGVKDALFSMGIAHVCLGYAGEAQVKDQRKAAGNGMVEIISLDDWVHDMGATHKRQWSYCGHRYRVPIDDLKDNKLYDQEVVKQLQPSPDLNSDEDGGEKVAAISRGGDTVTEELRETVELWDIWLPFERLKITISLDLRSARPLRIARWKGPLKGPYHILAYTDVPDQIMPLGLVNCAIDLHDVLNRAARKLMRRIDRSKNVVGVDPAASEDAERFKNAEDGQVIKLNSAGGIKMVNANEIDQAFTGAILWLKGLCSEMLGNVSLLAGLGPQSGTATQDELISGNANKRVEDMQDRTTEWVAGICHDLAWYAFSNPLLNRKLERVVQMGSQSYSIPFKLRAILGDFLDYNFNIEPFSMQHRTPNAKLAMLLKIYNEVLVPSAEPLAAQGLGLDFKGLFDSVVSLSSLDELTNLLIPLTSQPDEENAPRTSRSMGKSKSPVTTRRYERANVPASSQQGKEEALMKMMFGRGGAQESEMASTLRPTG